MAEFEYGPVEIVVVAFAGEGPDTGTLEAIAELVEGGSIRLLDAVLVSRDLEGNLEATEFEDLGDEIDVIDITLEASGLVGEDDLSELAAHVAPGTSAALLAIELLWAKKLASRLAESGGAVLQSERIPAPVVNAVLAEAELAAADEIQG